MHNDKLQKIRKRIRKMNNKKTKNNYYTNNKQIKSQNKRRRL